jgi:hypothetical protein
MVFLASVILSGFMTAHPVHVSLTSVEINTGRKTVSVSYKFYTNDLILLLYHVFEKDFQPEPDKTLTPAEIGVLDSYLSRAFILVNKKDTLSFKFLSKEQDEESIWLHYQANLSRKEIKTLAITNLLMLNIYEDQQNLVILSDGMVEKGYSFDLVNRQAAISFK